MSPGSRAGPSSTLPALHALELGGVVQLNDAVDLAVRVLVVLARVHLLALHVHRRDAEVSGRVARQGDLAAAVLGPGGCE